MTHTICRMYGNAEQATRAAEDLKKRRYQKVHVFTAAEGKANGHATDDVVAAMMKAYIYKPHAKIYAERIAKGGALVAVHAPFSTGVQAKSILDSYDPVDSGVPEIQYPTNAWDDSAPLSSSLQLPVLMKTQHPFHAISSLPMITGRDTHLSSCVGLPFRSRSATPLSSMFGLSLLSNSSTPLSSKFGLPLLTKK